VRLYLSSFRIGNEPEQLVALARGGKRAAVIANATDGYLERDAAVQRELEDLSALGFTPTEVDLRHADPERLADFDVVWIRGGNVFVLRDALATSGADSVLTELTRAGQIVYAGYSAGPCVAGPTLRGLELVDDATSVDNPRFDGLGLVDFALAPHYDSPGHPETDAINDVIAAYEAAGTAYRKLRDGEVIVIDGT
jgi:dipeptidase E